MEKINSCNHACAPKINSLLVCSSPCLDATKLAGALIFGKRIDTSNRFVYSKSYIMWHSEYYR